MLVTHGDGINARGFEIDRVEPGDGNTMIILADDPGLVIDGESTSEVYHPARSFERAIPAFVRDWLVWKYGDGRSIDHESIQQFLAEHLPDKQQREVLRNDLINGKELVLLDGFEVSVNLARGDQAPGGTAADEHQKVIWYREMDRRSDRYRQVANL